MSLDDAFDQVADFHRAFGHPVKERPAFLPSPRSDGRVAWMREEVDEFVEATDVVDQADAMIDLIYFALGTLVEMGVRPGPSVRYRTQREHAETLARRQPRASAKTERRSSRPRGAIRPRR